MRVIIRTDIGQEHGLGHASRMLALARALAARGVETLFATQTPALVEYVAPFACHDDPWPLSSNDVFILDHISHEFDHASLARLRPITKIVCVDDPSATAESCDLVVMPSLHTPSSTLARLQHDFGDRLLAGAEYVMLDQDVTAQPPIPYAERANGPIVFCAGGSDPERVLERLWRWTHDMLPDVRKVYLAPAQDTSHWWARGPYYKAVPFHRDYLREAALVVTTMGVTAYECLYWHTPVLVVGHTDRHCAAAEGFWSSVQRACCMGHVDIRTITPQQFCKEVSAAYTMPTARLLASAYSNGKLDGQGVERVAKKIMELV